MPAFFGKTGKLPGGPSVSGKGLPCRYWQPRLPWRSWSTSAARRRSQTGRGRTSSMAAPGALDLAAGIAAWIRVRKDQDTLPRGFCYNLERYRFPAHNLYLACAQGDLTWTACSTAPPHSTAYLALGRLESIHDGNLSMFDTGSTASKLASIDQWGDIEWSSMELRSGTS